MKTELIGWSVHGYVIAETPINMPITSVDTLDETPDTSIVIY